MKKIILTLITICFLSLGLVACNPPPNNFQPSLPIKAAFVYPWFPGAWTQGTFPFTNYTPEAGYYDSGSSASIDRQLKELQYAGLDAGIASWWGQGTSTDKNIGAMLTAADKTNFRWTLYYEQEGQGNPTVSQISSDLDYINKNYASHDSYLRVNNKPVIFVYADGTDSCSMVDRWTQANNGRFYIVLKIFSGYKNCANQPDSWHQYGPASATDTQPGYSYTISPGFWKKGEAAPRLVRDPTRWAANIQSMVASKAPWQLITTYNEWGEGTNVEPATQWASASGYGTYIDLLHQYLSGSSPTTTTTSVGSTSTTTLGSTTTTTKATTTTTVAPTTTTSTIPVSNGVCGQAGTPAVHQKVVVFSFENRTWSDVGGTQFQSIPYFNNLAKQCTTFSNYTEPNTSQNSATQYVGTETGSTSNTVLNDCSPSSSCNTMSDNIFRQARTAGKTAINYVEDATTGCSASGNAAKHIPDLYNWGADDRSFCNAQVRPYSEFDPNNLSDFSFITPTLCNDGHDCSNSTVNTWASNNVQKVLNSAAYKAGNVTVIIWYDEDHPVPNMFLNIHAKAGVQSTAIDYGSQLALWEDLEGFPRINHAIGAASIRTLTGI